MARRPTLLEHAIVSAGLSPDLIVTKGWTPPSADQLAKLFDEMLKLTPLLESIRSLSAPGYAIVSDMAVLNGRMGELKPVASAGDVSVAASAPAGAPDGATYVALASLSCVRAHVCDSIEMAATMWCGVDVCACTRVARQGWQ